MKSILVTGATGFVGRHLTEKLKNQNNNVIELNSKNFTNIWDYKDKIDYIIHLAVKTAAGGYCQKHPGEQYLINSDINNTILQYWYKYQSQAKMITFGSSCGYDKNSEKTEINYLKGEPEPGYEVYGTIKRNLLVGLEAIKQEYKMNYSYLIPSVLYGPGYDLHDNHFIFDLIRKISNAKNNGDKVILWGDGNQTRELIYIEDAVDIIIHSINWDNPIFNLSSGKSYTIREYAQTICDIIGYDFNLIEWDLNAFVGSPNKKLVNTHLQNYKFTPLLTGLTETIKYYETRSSSSK